MRYYKKYVTDVQRVRKQSEEYSPTDVSRQSADTAHTSLTTCAHRRMLHYRYTAQERKLISVSQQSIREQMQNNMGYYINFRYH